MDWRKSSFSGDSGNCVEIRQDLTAIRDSKNLMGPALAADLSRLVAAVRSGDDWRKASFSGSGGNCVEIRQDLAAVRDSKNPAGSALRTGLTGLFTAVKAGRLAR